MKDYLTAFFMAWGNFLSIPCPVKKWDENLRRETLAMLPLVGAVVGVLWFFLALILSLIKLPPVLTSFLLTFYIYRVSGYLHLDGFMDCTDAIMSRRPMEEKQRILKDSRVGAFAVISVVFLILGMFVGQYGLMEGTMSLGEKGSWIYLLPLIIVPVVSRSTSGRCVLGFRPMKTSQYADGKLNKTSKSKAATLALLILTLVLVLIPIVILAAFLGMKGLFIGLVSALSTMLGTWISILRGRRHLGGMNGDIAGYGISIGEATGVLATCLMIVLIGRV